MSSEQQHSQNKRNGREEKKKKTPTSIMKSPEDVLERNKKNSKLWSDHRARRGQFSNEFIPS
jgi:hypothetical protein